MIILLLTGLLVIESIVAFSQLSPKPRARDTRIPFDGNPGKFNAIRDVKGVEAGYRTLISRQRFFGKTKTELIRDGGWS